MADLDTNTVRLFIPKFDKVCDVNVSDAQNLRENYHAIDEVAYLAGTTKPKSGKGNPFGKDAKKNEGDDAAAADAADADAAAAAAKADAKVNTK